MNNRIEPGLLEIRPIREVIKCELSRVDSLFGNNKQHSSASFVLMNKADWTAIRESPGAEVLCKTVM